MSWLSRAFGRSAGEKPAETPVAPELDPNLCCSFCGKNRRDVYKLIAGPRVYICDECIGLCVHICDEEESNGAYLVNLMLGALAPLPPHARHTLVTPRLRAAIELAAGTPSLLRKILAIAWRFEDRATALAAIAAIPADQRSTDDHLNVVATLADFDRAADALTALDAIDAGTLTGVDVVLYRLHRAYAELVSGDVTRPRLAVHRKTALDLAPDVAALPAGPLADALHGQRLAVLTLSLLGLGELEEAELAARERTVRQPENASATELLARVLVARGDHAGAQAAWTKAIEQAHPDGNLARRLRATANGPFR